MKKSSITAIIVLLMVLTVCLYFISGTYARYADEYSGTAKVDVAKWNVQMTDGKSALENTFELPFVVESNTNVVADKIAPGSTATATMELDLTGTEVAVDFEATIDDAKIAEIFGDSADAVELTTSVEGAATSTSATTIALPKNGQAFDSSNGKVIVKLTLTWTNDDLNNASDTVVGETGSTLEIPVDITVQQHID